MQRHAFRSDQRRKRSKRHVRRRHNWPLMSTVTLRLEMRGGAGDARLTGRTARLNQVCARHKWYES